MSKQRINTPLTRAQVKALPIMKQEFIKNDKGYLELKTVHNGFTPTSIGITGQQAKRLGKNQYPKTNRKLTRGRTVQEIPVFARDAEGNKLIRIRVNNGRMEEYYPIVSVKRIWHRSARRLMNV